MPFRNGIGASPLSKIQHVVDSMQDVTTTVKQALCGARRNAGTRGNRGRRERETTKDYRALSPVFIHRERGCAHESYIVAQASESGTSRRSHTELA
jgi:hypothetical protein